QSRSNKTQPRTARLPFVSVISALREIMIHQKKAASRLSSLRVQKLANPAAQLQHSFHRTWREASEFLEKSTHQDDKSQQFFHAFPRVGIAGARFFSLHHAFPDHSNCGVEFAPLAFFQDYAE